MRLDYRVSESIFRRCVWKTSRPSHAEVKQSVANGLRWFSHFLDVNLNLTSSKSALLFHADNFEKYGYSPELGWAIYLKSQNLVLLNVISKAKWTLDGIVKMAAHEAGHKYLTMQHLVWDDYANGGSHVMKLGAGTTYFNSFSPGEIWLAQKKGFRLNKRPVHPFARQFAKSDDKTWRKNNLDKLKSIVNQYGSYHANLYKWQNTHNAPLHFEYDESKETDDVCICGGNL